MLGRFKNKVAIVTGAASGIGYETAKRFAFEGAQVVAVDVDATRLERFASLPSHLDHEVMSLAVDIGDVSQIRTAMKRIVGQYACVDILMPPSINS
jgi:NADP-dependent 3-hydroxy acid dehydrogenase YdfG